MGRLTSDVQLRRQHNKELVGRLDDMAIQFENSQCLATERKKIIEKKNEVIRLLQQENEAYACSSIRGSDRDSYKSSRKVAVITDDYEIQFKSLADAYAAKDSIKDCYSTYSNLIASSKNDGPGDLENQGPNSNGVAELQNALKVKKAELDVLKQQDSCNLEVISKLRQLVWTRDVECHTMKNENSKLLAQIKAMQNNHLKELKESIANKNNEDNIMYHLLLKSVVEYDGKIKKIFNWHASAPSSSTCNNALEKCDPRQTLKNNLSLIEMSIKEKPFMKKIKEQANEKFELQNEVKRLKKEQEQVIQNESPPLNKKDSQVYASSPSHEISIL